MKNNLKPDVIINEVFQKKCLFQRMASPDADAKINYSFSYGVVENEIKHGASELILHADGVNHDGKTALFKCEISYIGVFYLQKAKSKTMMKDFLEKEAPAILLPFIRESLSSLSIKAGLPHILLPATDMSEVLNIQDWENEK